MRYTDLIYNMKKQAGIDSFFKLLSRLVYGTDFEEDEQEAKDTVMRGMGDGFKDAMDTARAAASTADTFSPSAQDTNQTPEQPESSENISFNDINK